VLARIALACIALSASFALAALSAGGCAAGGAATRSDAVREGLALEAGPHPDRAAAKDRYEDACLAGDPAGCYHFGRHERTRRIRDAAAHARATAPLGEACDRGDLRACHRLGLLLDDDSGMPLDGRGAFDAFETACDGGHAPSCGRLATLYRVGPPSSDPGASAKALDLYGRACDAGFPGPCRAAAVMLGDDPARAKALEERACRLGDTGACTGLARAAWPEVPFACDRCPEGQAVGDPLPARVGGPLERSGRMAASEARGGECPGTCAPGEGRGGALPLVTDDRCVECRIAACRREHCCETCPGRDTVACCADVDLPVADHPLVTPKPDPAAVARAEAEARRVVAPLLPILREGCDAGVGRACADLGRVLSADLSGEGLARARAAFRRACDLRDAHGCDGLAESLETGAGGPPDGIVARVVRVRAKALHRKACDDGYTGHCWAAME